MEKTLDNNNTHNNMYLQNVESKVQDLEKALDNDGTDAHSNVCLQSVGSKFQHLERAIDRRQNVVEELIQQTKKTSH